MSTKSDKGRKRKEKAETTLNNKVKETKGNSLNICLLLSSAAALVIAVGCFQIYKTVTDVPELPQLDLNMWWGSNTTKTQDTSIRPFRIIFSDAMQENLRRFFMSYRDRSRMKSLNESWTYGIHHDALGQIFGDWQYKYSFRGRVRYLNKFDHFKTYIQGLDMHFVHVKPEVDKNIKVYPILLLHGWPSTMRDFFEVIPSLTTPRPGYDFVFEVIAPSLPGFVYSQAASKPGMTSYQMAIVMRNLMQRLGFKKFYVQGGDFGHTIGSHMATLFPDQVLGFHTNFPVNFSKFANLVWVLGSIWPTYFYEEHSDTMYPLKDKVHYLLEEFGYMHLQGTKPDTVGIALQDSPVGLAAYMVDRFMILTNINNKYKEDGGLREVSTTNFLDNIMLYWSTGSITTALRLYKETFMNSEMEKILESIPTPVPTWGLRTKYEIMHQPDWVLKRKYPALTGTTTLDVGGHFAALEIPNELADDIFKAVNSFLQYNKVK